jgi:hypothetical protein
MSNGDSEYYYAHPENPFEPVPARSPETSRTPIDLTVSSAPSVADSMDLVDTRDAADSEDGGFSEIGDGMRTPASAWTDVDSVVGEQ